LQKEDPKYQKYFMMLKIRLPDGAVQQYVKKMLKIRLPDGAVRTAMMRDCAT
jgi:hypothetical protein